MIVRPMPNPVEIFIANAPEDEAWCKRLTKYLSPMERKKLITIFHASVVGVGADWAKVTTDHLQRAHVILLLLSVDFLASEDLWKRHVDVVRERGAKHQPVVVPVMVRACDWHLALGKLTPLPKDGRAVKGSRDEDETLTEVADGIEEIVLDMLDMHVVKLGKIVAERREALRKKHNPGESPHAASKPAEYWDTLSAFGRSRSAS